MNGRSVVGGVLLVLVVGVVVGLATIVGSRQACSGGSINIFNGHYAWLDRFQLARSKALLDGERLAGVGRYPCLIEPGDECLNDVVWHWVAGNEFCVVGSYGGYSIDEFGSSVDNGASVVWNVRHEMIRLPNGMWQEGFPFSGMGMVQVGIHWGDQTWLLTTDEVHLWDEQRQELVEVYRVPAGLVIDECVVGFCCHQLLRLNGRDFGGLLVFQDGVWEVVPYKGRFVGRIGSVDGGGRSRVVLHLKEQSASGERDKVVFFDRKGRMFRDGN